MEFTSIWLYNLKVLSSKNFLYTYNIHLGAHIPFPCVLTPKATAQVTSPPPKGMTLWATRHIALLYRNLSVLQVTVMWTTVYTNLL